jgi:hypothetical protein
MRTKNVTPVIELEGVAIEPLECEEVEANASATANFQNLTSVLDAAVSDFVGRVGIGSLESKMSCIGGDDILSEKDVRDRSLRKYAIGQLPTSDDDSPEKDMMWGFIGEKFTLAELFGINHGPFLPSLTNIGPSWMRALNKVHAEQCIVPDRL